jgi:Tol biopolymer transport system component
VSSGGGRFPRWSPDSRELFYLASDGQLMAVPVRTTPSLQVGRPTSLFGLVGGAQRWAGFEVLPDGRFLAIVSEIVASEQPLTVVLNWTNGLTKP